MNLYAEVHDPLGTMMIHVDSPLGDGRTLCGLPLEGVPNVEMRFLPKGRVTCQTCWSIIAHCKAIPASAVAYPVGRPNNPKRALSA